jgi:CheY-like chemotaxis protein
LGLQGNLEDLPLLDIIQIVSFSRKTGYLAIAMEGGDGAIVFHDGLVVAAFTAGSPPPDPRLGALPRDARDRAVRARIVFALEQLARLREGAFAFELSEAIPATVGPRDIRLETLAAGTNPQELLLEIAQGIDEDRAHSAAAVEASFAAPEEGVVGEEPIVPATAFARDRSVTDPHDPDATSPRGLASPPRPSALAPPAVAPSPAPAVAPEPAATPAAPPAGPSPPHDDPDATISPAARVAAPPPAPGPCRTLLLADDEDDVRRILAGHFTSAAFRVEEACDPDSATKVAGRLRDAEEPFVLVTDLGMPASGGASFHGGFEVVKRLWKMNLRPPVLMMTESLNQSLRLRARQMGVQAFVFKPTLSKLNPRQFEADLSAFARKLAADVLPRLAESAALRLPVRPGPPGAPRGDVAPAPVPAGVAPVGDAQPYEFLRRSLDELAKGGDANQIAVVVMKVAREFFERAILFVVKNDEARGLGGFGLAPREETLNLLARQVAIPLAEESVFRDVVVGRRPFAGPLPKDRWSGHLAGRIGRFQSRGVAILPLVSHHETIALVYGDNPETGREPARLDALEVFLRQAGVALENVFLQRKVEGLRDKARPGVG